MAHALKRIGGSLLMRNGHICRTCCAPTLCRLSLDTAGGNDGYDHTYPAPEFTAAGGTLNVDFEAYNVKDRIILTADSGVIYDSGCISGNVTPAVSVPAGTTQVRVQVLPRCDGSEAGTSWTLSISCEIPYALRGLSSAVGSSAVGLSMARFQVCRSCEHQLDGGFSCRLYQGCCFGRRRGEKSFQCPAGKW